MLELETQIGRQLIAAQLYWTKIRQKLGFERHALALTACFVVSSIAGYAVLAHPWDDHQPQAQQIVRAAACAGAAELVRGARHEDVLHAATSAATGEGFREAHGNELAVTHSKPEVGRIFFVKATMSYRPAHFLLEFLIENTSQKALEVAIVDQSNLEYCSDDNSFNTFSQR